MDIILYNPLSSKGGSQRDALKLVKKLNRKKQPNQLIDLLTINNINDFIKENNHANRIIVVGGDGTLNHLVNNLTSLDFNPKLYLYSGGTGNDFARSIKGKKKLVDIKKYFLNLPKITFNNTSKQFLNGVGLGLDGLVVHKVNNSKFKNNKFNYYRHTLEAFREHQASNCIIEADGTIYEFKKTWLVSVMNSKYFGGGMKIAPKAKRDSNHLDIVIVLRANKLTLFLLFPFIYLGWHTIFKRYVKVINAKNVKITYLEPKMMQIDGDGYEKITEIYVSK